MAQGTNFTPTHAANSLLANLSAFVTEELPKVVKTEVYLASPFLDLLKDSVEYQSGPNIVVPMQVRPVGGTRFFKGFDARTHSFPQPFDTAVMQWANVESPAAFSWEDEMIASGQGPSGSSKLLANTMKAVSAAHGDQLAYQLFVNTVGSKNPSNSAAHAELLKGPNGISEIVNNAAVSAGSWAAQGAYAGMTHNPTNYPEWYGQFDSSLTVCNNDSINKLFQLLAIKGGKYPTHALTSMTNYNRLYAQNQTAQILEVKATQEVGFTGLIVNGVKILVDFHCPSKTLSPDTIAINGLSVTNPLVPNTASEEYFYAFNKGCLRLVYNKSAQATVSAPFSLDPVGINGVGVKIISRCNLVCDVRRQVGLAVFTS